MSRARPRKGHVCLPDKRRMCHSLLLRRPPQPAPGPCLRIRDHLLEKTRQGTCAQNITVKEPSPRGTAGGLGAIPARRRCGRQLHAAAWVWPKMSARLLSLCPQTSPQRRVPAGISPAWPHAWLLVPVRRLYAPAPGSTRCSCCIAPRETQLSRPHQSSCVDAPRSRLAPLLRNASRGGVTMCPSALGFAAAAGAPLWTGTASPGTGLSLETFLLVSEAGRRG